MKHPAWVRRPLVELCEQTGDIRCGPFGTQLNKREFMNEGIPLWGIKHVNSSFSLNTDEFVASATAKRLSQYDLRPGDLVMTRKGTVGNCAIYPETLDPGIMHSDLLRLRLDLALVDPAFLINQLHHSPDVHRQLSLISGGAIMPGINVGRLKQLCVELPPLDEQRRIAAILDAADALRVKRRASLEQLDTLLQSTFLEMFGDPVVNPFGWRVVPVGGEIRFLTSGSRGWAKYYSDEGDIFIRIQNLRSGRLDLGEIAYVDAPNSAESNRTRVEPGDVLLSITADLGRTGVVPVGIGKAHINQHLVILRFTEINPVFVGYQLASRGGQAQFLRLNREGVKAGLNFTDVKKIRLIKPPLDLQRKFATIVESVEKQKERQRAHLAELDTLFASLQQRAFRGDL